MVGKTAVGVMARAASMTGKTRLAAHLSAERLHSLRQALLVDTGAISEGTSAAFRTLAPQLRQQWAATPLYATLTEAHRQALDRYFDTNATGLTEEVMNGAPAVLDRYAPRLAAILSEAELADVIAFAHSQEGRQIFVDGVVRGASGQSGGSPTFTAAQTDALVRFEQTPGGHAFNSHTDQINPLLGEIGRAATSAPAVRRRLLHDICSVLEDQCTPPMRAAGESL
ncbi:MAG: hypothetical protein HY054_03715 [Proteobacteria bacterium]|nr:hypothetical protein [Pseudomonadota bacterium]